MRSKCKRQDCKDYVEARGYCVKHYNAARKAGEFEFPLCSVEWCTEVSKAKGFCPTHYQRDKLGADMDKPFRAWRSGKPGVWYINPKGYVYRTTAPDENGKRSIEAQHRMVMAEVLERPLLSHETPHHKNGVRHDNRPENLELWSTSQPAGQRITDKLAWAREIINLYGGTKLDV